MIIFFEQIETNFMVNKQELELLITTFRAEYPTLPHLFSYQFTLDTKRMPYPNLKLLLFLNCSKKRN